MEKTKKAGTVALIGRPNVGKSTLVNALVGHKVSITSPKPQTTRFNIHAVYEDDRGQIIFVDTPGIFGKIEDELARKINPRAEESLSQGVDVIVYMIDHTRKKDFEENKTFGIVRKARGKKILVVNKIDIKKPSYSVQYAFMEEEFEHIVRISALKRKHLDILLTTIFSLLPEKEKLIDTTHLTQPGLNLDSKLYLAELIREKAFLFLRQELPYSITAVVDEISERDNGTLYIQARILTHNDKYKRMIVGSGGSMIKQISMAARKELETATNTSVYIDLAVDTDPHWIEYA